MTTTITPHEITVNAEGEGAATFSQNGVLVSVPNTHPEFKRIVRALINGDSPAPFLDLSKAVEGLDGRVTVTDGAVLFNGEKVHSSLANTILRYRREGRDTDGLVKFLERLEQNPSRRSRQQLFDWTEAKSLTIDAEGYFIGFKGVNVEEAPTDLDDEGDQTITTEQGEQVFLSVTAGTAFVNGVEITGQIPQRVGDVVTMLRENVQDDVTIGCSYGLHVGSYDYAHDFGTSLLEVRTDPADVVSVPSDSAFQKLRCCRYEVLSVQEVKTPDVSHYEPEAEADEYEDFEDEIVESLQAADVPLTFLQRLFNRRAR